VTRFEANTEAFPAERLAAWAADARDRSLALVDDLDDSQVLGPQLETVNPLIWEIGHVTWFQEHFVLRRFGGEGPYRREVDALYDSIAIPHEVRWELPILSRDDTRAYLENVRGRIQTLLAGRKLDATETYLLLLTIFHEDMHTEAFTYTRQTLGYPAPGFLGEFPLVTLGRTSQSDEIEIAGGPLMLGACADAPFSFDNEHDAQPVEVGPFALDRDAVSQGDFQRFVDAGGYQNHEWWSRPGWAWREAGGVRHPLYWRREAEGVWSRRWFDTWSPIDPAATMINVNWFEANAYCAWLGRRLPSESEWEFAATGANPKCMYPWGTEQTDSPPANLDWRHPGCVAADTYPAGESPFGCRQMLGDAWEWTATDFQPFGGFEPGPYREYSLPLFGHAKVLRGGCWATRSRMINNTYRNYYGPERRDVWAGFRTCRTLE
jgi:iron(II)-dependent oxidoreductase